MPLFGSRKQVSLSQLSAAQLEKVKRVLASLGAPHELPVILGAFAETPKEREILQQAAELLNTAWKEDYDLVYPCMLGSYYMLLGEYVLAVEALEDGIEELGEDARLLFALGSVYYRLSVPGADELTDEQKEAVSQLSSTARTAVTEDVARARHRLNMGRREAMDRALDCFKAIDGKSLNETDRQIAKSMVERTRHLLKMTP